jgi:hypothetical protein
MQQQVIGCAPLAAIDNVAHLVKLASFCPTSDVRTESHTCVAISAATFFVTSCRKNTHYTDQEGVVDEVEWAKTVVCRSDPHAQAYDDHDREHHSDDWYRCP